MNLSMVLFLKLLIKTCDVVQSTTSTSVKGRRAANVLEVEHLAKAVKRYEVLTFMEDLLKEMHLKSMRPKDLPNLDLELEQSDQSLSKRKDRMGSDEGIPDDDADVASKKPRSSQVSITSFFKPN